MLANDSKSTSGKEVLCKVCGDRASGKHYGVASCDGCRGFFKRSIRRNLQYVCKEGGKCMIDVMRRNQCQACRFAKCLMVNMRREAVQHERAPRSSAAPPCSLVSIPFDIYNPQKVLPFRPANIFLPLPTLLPNELVYKPLDNNFNTNYHHPHRDSGLLNAVFDKQHYPHHVELNNNSPDRLQSTKDEPATKGDDPNRKELIFESAAKLLYFAVKWTRSIPHYNHLPARDQSILLESSWAELFLVMASQWGLPLESLASSKDLDNIRKVLQQFRDLKVDVAEASCLMALILFKPISQISTLSYEYITLVKDQSIAYMIDKCGAFRLGHLLLLLPLIKSVAIPKFIQHSKASSTILYRLWREGELTLKSRQLMESNTENYKICNCQCVATTCGSKDTFFKGTVGEVAIERLLGDLI